MSVKQTSNKRTASTAGINHSDKDPVAKRTKLEAALETKLAELQQTVASFVVEWKEIAPEFVDAMIVLRDELKKLTPNTVNEYIKGRGLKDTLWMLQSHERKINKPLHSVEPEDLEFIKQGHERILDYIAEVRTRLTALTDQAHVKPSPKEFADSKEWRKYQQWPSAILCLRPADKKGLPIHLMHAAFCNFTRHFHEPPLDENTTKYLTIANELCQVMPSAFDSENARRETFERYFAPIDKDLKPHIEFFLSPKVSTVTESGGRVNVAKTIDYKGGHLTVLLEEFKVESTGDAYMQICRSYEVLCEEEKNKHLLKFGNPMFLLCVLGPYIMVCGAAKRENVHVEPLTPLLPMFPGLGIESRPVQIAHCLRALKEGLDALRDFWQVAGIVENAEKKTFTGRLPEPYLVPHCPDNSLLRFGDWQGVFELPSRHRDDSNKLPSFSAILNKADDKSQYQAVVKFVYNYSGTYGTTVHQYLHSLGLAPSLYLTENLHRGLVMVVMERLSYEKGIGGWMELDTFEGKLGTKAGAIRKKLEKVIKSLQEQGMVHADLRPTNIMVKVDGNDDILMREEEPILHVVDFDWAGNVGDVCYPPFLNPNVLWPSGAKAYQKVGKNDDKILLDNWWDMFVEGREAI